MSFLRLAFSFNSRLKCPLKGAGQTMPNGNYQNLPKDLPDGLPDPFYRDGQLYDAINSHLLADVDFYLDEAARIGGPILEIACGTGRITIPMAKTGVAVVGIDISAAMLTEARRKARGEKLSIEWIQTDAIEFHLGRKFKFIFMAYNSLQHLLSLESLESFFSCVREHLAANGTFILDVINPNIGDLSQGRQRYRAMDLIDPQSGMPATIEEAIHYDVARQVNRVKWFYSLANGKVNREDQLNMRCFFPQELEALVKYNGFELSDKFGNFNREPFVGSSPKQILVLRAAKGKKSK